jgi:hypothetical protein
MHLDGIQFDLWTQPHGGKGKYDHEQTECATRRYKVRLSKGEDDVKGE